MMSLSCWRIPSPRHQANRLWAIKGMLSPQIKRYTMDIKKIMPLHSTRLTVEGPCDSSSLV